MEWNNWFIFFCIWKLYHCFSIYKSLWKGILFFLGFLKSGYIILFSVLESIILCTYLSHLLSENYWGTDSLCGQILPQWLHKMYKPAPLKIKAINEYSPLESATKIAYWEVNRIVHILYKQGRNGVESNISESKENEHLACA